ncbi:MAG: kinase inhibitor [Candidatus Zambryskibacteria bacterium RIFCSPHIGHO2_01_FULL_43_25]|uniref:Kinase inhibitor n=1 Tax=Candidatus Zambryskibacteria bacterium RIFCSPLOWO2_01_FULL_45_21 TaxID=1802761 RepID=A0A1G2U377_9BACT|nr:MAG: kinase inhibitor [Candidatus Zambryskibacteria bacterium RIFCSPHIGHO2_01_FULL_43_25]OHB01002.1 MAG: kinase inhibitor [Candidatus Zambryskibacteria bacterium RIFCSPHIGHO2_12_FULL_44_12b]OHB03953.1 MAG: kinase inhibitor [Candidatus Zambryskibacteria bacterium RIFCSPLOWO2_01_FULL_45_21]
MKITSSAFNNSGLIPAKYTRDGDDISPPLYFENVPKDAQSLVLIVNDPDVPKDIRSDGTWIHWVLFNIDPKTTHVESGKMPNAIPGRNTGGSGVYEGPCPPYGEHRYFFKLFALDSTLDLSPGSLASAVEKAMAGHVIAETELMGKYKRE